MPSFVDTQSVSQLARAMSTADAEAGAASATAAEGTGVTAFGAGLSSFLPDLLKPSNGDTGTNGAALTTADFSNTLQQARLDTGEVRALADEVRQRAEEISERFAGAAMQPIGVAPPAATTPDKTVPGGISGHTPVAASSLGTNAPPTTSQAAVDAGVPPVASASPQFTGSDAANLLVQPSAPPSSDVAAAASQITKSDAPAPLDGRMALGHRDAAAPAAATAAIAPVSGGAEAATGIEIIPSHAPAAAPPPERRGVSLRKPAVRRLPGMAAPIRTTPARQAPTGKADAGTKGKAQTANRTGSTVVAATTKHVSAKPPILRSSTEAALAAAAKEAAAKQAGSAPGTPVTPQPSGGLFSSLKPFTLPREIGSQGWDAGN